MLSSKISETSLGAVSYTHLDVYKRQTHFQDERRYAENFGRREFRREERKVENKTEGSNTKGGYTWPNSNKKFTKPYTRNVQTIAQKSTKPTPEMPSTSKQSWPSHEVEMNSLFLPDCMPTS